MKKAKSGRPKTVVKRKAPSRNFDEYLAAVPQRGRGALKQIRTAIPRSRLRQPKQLVMAIIDALEKDLKGFSTSKGTIHFPMDKPRPAALIKKLVKPRVVSSKQKAADRVCLRQCTMLTAITGVMVIGVLWPPGITRVPTITPMVDFQLYSTAGANPDVSADPKFTKTLSGFCTPLGSEVLFPTTRVFAV
jgi:hypothetical protein